MRQSVRDLWARKGMISTKVSQRYYINDAPDVLRLVSFQLYPEMLPRPTMGSITAEQVFGLDCFDVALWR